MIDLVGLVSWKSVGCVWLGWFRSAKKMYSFPSNQGYSVDGNMVEETTQKKKHPTKQQNNKQ